MHFFLSGLSRDTTQPITTLAKGRGERRWYVNFSYIRVATSVHFGFVLIFPLQFFDPIMLRLCFQYFVMEHP
jgi:hypothetical protein